MENPKRAMPFLFSVFLFFWFIVRVSAEIKYNLCMTIWSCVFMENDMVTSKPVTIWWIVQKHRYNVCIRISCFFHDKCRAHENELNWKKVHVEHWIEYKKSTMLMSCSRIHARIHKLTSYFVYSLCSVNSYENSEQIMNLDFTIFRHGLSGSINSAK